ncbi:hypothetical protein UFOVP1146_6 [uncultured Caudovirales phage]|uniref:Uncharacterized protein n=1 Tax=uncultured Caudovirales phage TaxID=2100421 RepID=A0A6J5T2P7_9CAUD|nr:hypothetical protein UFOVP812_339 [uncultured Caudovirales phage]CAB4165690.1 hypothetical protein UFOVP818_226 [uncultured Caudovirales phage]CAB4186614.1 hypothetical protein UFOVP1146_6 [uncultured Caudovirales phage]CAB4221064.1 hypothetical protein UFOVP1638_139 [uncultured Caudovirales phage]
MRNILNIINTLAEGQDLELTESTGGLARRWIEVQSGKEIPFINSKTKEEYHMVGLYILPEDPMLAYEDAPDGSATGPELLNQAIQDTIDGIIPPIGTPAIEFGAANSRAAIIVVMQDLSGEQHVFVKKSKAKRGSGPNALFWQTTDFARDTGLWAQTAQMKKAAIPIEPTDFVQAGVVYSVNQIVPTVKMGMDQNPTLPATLKAGVPALLTNVITDNSTPVPGMAEYQPVVEIKLSEIAAPLALVTGNFMKGHYDKVTDELLGPMGTSWQKASGISFPAKAEKLIDAVVHFGNEKIDVSVKDSKGGGRPSTATIVETINKFNFSPKFKKTYAKEIAALDILNNISAIDAPLDLAVNTYHVLDAADVAFLKTIYSKNVKTAKLTPNWKELLDNVTYSPDKTHPEYQLGFHLLAVVAKYVAAQLNEDPDKITNFFKEVLNKSSLVQVYAKTSRDSNGGLAYSQFTATWPPVFEGTIEVDADSYTARTRPSRKISFSFNTGKGKSIADVAQSSNKPAVDLTDYEAAPVDLKAADTVTVKKSTPAADKKKFGRARQR